MIRDNPGREGKASVNPEQPPWAVQLCCTFCGACSDISGRLAAGLCEDQRFGQEADHERVYASYFEPELIVGP